MLTFLLLCHRLRHQLNGEMDMESLSYMGLAGASDYAQDGVHYIYAIPLTLMDQILYLPITR